MILCGEKVLLQEIVGGVGKEGGKADCILKNLEIYTAPDQHFKIQMLNLWMSWENLCPNFTFTVENKMGNSHKRGWSHFKLNIND